MRGAEGDLAITVMASLSRVSSDDKSRPLDDFETNLEGGKKIKGTGRRNKASDGHVVRREEGVRGNSEGSL
jgi:hypothetical protein